MMMMMTIHMEAAVSSNMLANFYTTLKPSYGITFTTPFSVPSCCSRLLPVFCIYLSLSHLQSIQTGSGTHPTSYSFGGIKMHLIVKLA
jgi:hypothetical protein